MRAWLRRGAVALLVFTACWIGAVWYWRSTNRMPASGDLLTYMLFLPLALLLALVVVRWAGTRVLAMAGAGAAAGSAVSATAAASPSTSAPLAAQPAPSAPSMIIADTAVRLPHGDSAGQLAGAFADGSVRTTLDQRLLDNDGFPAMTARVAYAIDPAVKADIAAWLVANTADGAPIEPAEEQWRALCMASATVTELAKSAASMYSDEHGAVPVLRMVPLLPADWPAPLRQAAPAWLRHMVVQMGWPEQQVLIDAAAATTTATASADAGAVIARLIQQGANVGNSAVDSTASMYLLVAFESHLAQDTVSTWADSASLFTASNAQGLIPGEGAAALLLVSESLARAHAHLYGVMPSTRLYTPAIDRREQSPEAARRLDASVLTALVQATLERSATVPAAIGLVVADSGQRVNRVLEVAGVASATVPQLDAGADFIAVGNASGACGAVSLVAALALAHQQAIERAAPVLCLGNEDPHYRCAALIGPVVYAS